MTQTFKAPLTPHAARRIVMLAEANSRVEIDPAIREIAKQGMLAPADLSAYHLGDAAQAAVQQLIDFDMRAAIALPNNGPHRVDWLSPLLVAMHLHGGFKTLLVNGDYEAIDISQFSDRILGSSVEVLTFNRREHLNTDFLKTRDSTLYLHANMTGFVGGLPTETSIFHHSVFVGLQRLTSGLQMYPHMPTLTSVLGINSNKLLSRGFKTSVPKVSFLFNVVTALSRDV